MKQTICPNCGGSLESVAIGWRCKKCKGFISLKDGKFYEYVEKPFMPPQTHADRIRAMSDEELAEWIVKKTKHQASAWSKPTYLNFLTESDDTLESAIKGTAEWLKQPAEDK